MKLAKLIKSTITKKHFHFYFYDLMINQFTSRAYFLYDTMTQKKIIVI